MTSARARVPHRPLRAIGRALRLALPFGSLAAVGLVAAPALVRADEAVVLDKMVDLNRAALAAYDAGKFEGARDRLLEAVVLGKESGLGTHQAMARTYLHLGAVYVGGLKDRPKGVRYFDLALKLRPDIQLTPALATPSIEAAFAEAGGKTKRRPGATPPAREREREREREQDGAQKPTKRAAGSGDPTAAAPIEQRAPAPGDPGAPPPAGAAPRASAPEPAPGAGGPAAAPPTEGGETGAGPPAAEVDASTPVARVAGERRFFVALGLGTGVGVHGRRELELHGRSVGAGLTPGLWGHALPELGYQVTDDFAVSLQGRHQIIPESGTADEAGRPARSAHALLARAQWTAKRRGRGALLLTGAVGGGNGFRLVVAPQPDVQLFRNDTVRGGPIIAGPGVAWAHRFTERLLATVELRALAGFPDLAAVLDLGAGASYAF